MSTWEEIRQLASDLQRIQLGDSAKKLADRNCVEIVSKLIDSGLVDLVFSIDGKEYITRHHLTTQIKNECLGNRGRVSLVDLQQVLNVEYQTIESQVQDLVKFDASFILAVGQLISREYLESICREINERLQEEGCTTVSHMTKSFDLPSDLLQREIYSSMEKGIIEGFADKDDSNILYTTDYVQRQKAAVRGALSGMTKVTQVSRLLKDLQLQPNLFFQIADELLKSGQVRGQLVGGRHGDRAIFIPHLYTELLRGYSLAFYRQNGFLEFNSLKKLGITDISQHLKEVLSEADRSGLVHLGSCVVGQHIWSQICENTETGMAKDGWTDVGVNLPPEINTPSDCSAACALLINKHSRSGVRCVLELAIIPMHKVYSPYTSELLLAQTRTEHQKTLFLGIVAGSKTYRTPGSDWLACEDAYLYCDSLPKDCLPLFTQMLAEKASKEAPDLMKAIQTQKAKDLGAQLDEKPSNKKKGGGGKKGAKKNKGKGDADDDIAAAPPSASHFEFMNEQDLVERLQNQERLSSCPTEILTEVAERLRPDLNALYRQKVESVFLSSQQDSATQQKHSHAEFRDRMRQLYSNICLFDAGAEIFDENVAGQLRAYLLRTFCTDAANLALSYSSGATSLSSQKACDSAIAGLENSRSRDAYKQLYASITGKKDDLNEFFDALDEISGPGVCALNLKPPDKRIKADLLSQHTVELKAQLQSHSDQDAAGGLLLALLYLAARRAGAAVHASGKFVPNLVSMLQTRLPKELMLLIAETQQAVVKSLKKSADAQDAATLARGKFTELKEKVLDDSFAESEE